MLRCDAAERLTALSAEFEAEFGYPIPITDSYRSYGAQVTLAGIKPHLAAIPGTSNHGWGIAVDLGNPIAGGNSTEYVWLRVHGPDYGWDNPSWARLGGAKPEPWHFEFFAAGSIPNRAIDPSDVGTWAPGAPAAPGNEDGAVVVPASTRTPGETGAPSEGVDGADHGTASGADGDTPAQGDGSAPKPADPTPAPPAEPAPSKPAPSDPPEEDPDTPAEPDTGVVGEVVDDTVELVDGTVNGVVGGLVGGLLGTD
jgi:hypothetical protein